MRAGKYAIISGSALVVVIALGYFLNWYIQSKKVSEILDPIRNFDFSSAETEVISKITHLVDYTETNVYSDESWGKLGMNLYIHDYKELAVPCFKKAHELNNKEFRWPYFCGVALDELNSNEAIDWYERSNKLNPAYPPLCVRLGNRYLLTDQLDDAEKAFNSIAEKEIEIPHVYLGLAKISIERGMLETAKNLLNNALDLAPKFREAHALLAEVYRREGDRSKAGSEFDIMKDLPVRLDLSDPVYYQMVNEGVSSFWYQVRGNNFIKDGNLAAAENEFRKALEAKPNQTSFTSLGYVYQLRKKYDEALHQYQAALGLDSNYVEAVNNLGIIYFQKGDVDKGIRMVEKALRIQPGLVDGYLNLGTFYKHKKSYLKAVNYFKKGLSLESEDYRFAYQLAWIYASCPLSSLRNGTEAIRLAKKVCEYHNYMNAKSLDLLAAAYAEDRQFQKAVETASQASKLANSEFEHDLAGDINKRLQLYKRSMAFRE